MLRVNGVGGIATVRRSLLPGMAGCRIDSADAVRFPTHPGFYEPVEGVCGEARSGVR